MEKRTQKELKKSFANGLRCLAYDAMDKKDLSAMNQLSILLKDFNEFIHVTDDETINKNSELAQELYETCKSLGYYN